MTRALASTLGLVALLAAACAARRPPGASVTSATPPPPTRTAGTRPSSHAAPSPEPAPATAPERGTTRELRLVATMLDRVETVRGIESKKPVPGVVLDRPALIARVKEHVADELPPQAIRNEGLELELFGFLPARFDYEDAEYRLLEDQLAGYYEPADGAMYLASDLGDDEASATLAHELVHALQDQRWDLKRLSKYQPGDGDRAEALSALAEGDATSAMFDVMIAHASPGSGKTAIDMPDDVFIEQIRRGINQGPDAQVPHVMRASLAAPYIYGTLFVHALRRRGGWDEVNRAWDDPPTTSEQVLHVDKWLAHEGPLEVSAPAFASLGSGWTVADEDSEGELGTRLAFEEWMDANAADEAARGWGGDRGVLLTSGDRAAFAWRLRYDADAKRRDGRAARAFDALTHAFDRTFGGPAASDAGFACRERADRGPLAVARVDGDLIVTLGPAKKSAAGWTPAGDCALARRWVREIAARP